MATPTSTPSPSPSPSSPKLIPPITTVTATNDAVSVSPTKKPQPIPWTHQETVNLIKAYQEKWYAVKRGPLRSNQWEEVAVVVAARCGYDFAHPSSKSAVQCRHKMEKLRQRHRAVKRQRFLAGGSGIRSGRGFAATAVWQYSGLMDELERGPLPISAQPLASLAPLSDCNDNYNNCGENDEDFDEEEEDERENYLKSKSINYGLNQRPSMNNYRRVLKEHATRGTWRVDDHDHDDDEDDYKEKKRVVVDERVLVSCLTKEIRAFADRFVGMENLKMEMMKETERCRLEMENRRIEMILESRRRTIDLIGRAFGSSKKLKMSEET